MKWLSTRLQIYIKLNLRYLAYHISRINMDQFDSWSLFNCIVKKSKYTVDDNFVEFATQVLHPCTISE